MSVDLEHFLMLGRVGGQEDLDLYMFLSCRCNSQGLCVSLTMTDFLMYLPDVKTLAGFETTYKVV